MRFIPFILFLVCFCNSIFSQKIELSGIAKDSINHHPAYFVDNDVELLHYKQKEGQGISIFTVSKSLSKKETVIWHSSVEDTTNMLLTNARLADLKSLEYVNFIDDKKNIPQLYSYFNKKTNHGDLKLFIGGEINRNDVPINDYSGLVSEMLIYDKVLSYKERQKVESYLALKYGIALDQTFPVSYVDSDGNIIWDAYLNAIYAYSIAGLGRDDYFSFSQNISGSSFGDDILEIEAKNFIDNKSFLVWSDNNSKLNFKEEEGDYKRLLRVWALTNTNFEGFFKLYFDTEKLQAIHPLKQGEHYWLAVDRSASGDFEGEELDFYIADADKGIVCFDNINCFENSNGRCFFTIMASKDIPQKLTREDIKDDFSNNEIEEVVAYPNPSSDGYVTLKIQLKEAMSVNLMLCNINGKKVSEKKLTGSDYYRQSLQFLSKGVWLINLKTEHEHKTITIIYE
jgi:hypothetical protein